MEKKNPWVIGQTGLSLNFISVHTSCVTSGQQATQPPSEPQVPGTVAERVLGGNAGRVVGTQQVLSEQQWGGLEKARALSIFKSQGCRPTVESPYGEEVSRETGASSAPPRAGGSLCHPHPNTLRCKGPETLPPRVNSLGTIHISAQVVTQQQLALSLPLG